jgi:hypothetical protein
MCKELEIAERNAGMLSGAISEYMQQLVPPNVSTIAHLGWLSRRG